MKTIALTLATVLFAALMIGCGGASTNSNTANNAANHDMSNMNGHDMSNMNHDMSNMNGHDMSKMDGDMQSSPDADKQPYDLQFIDTMIVHHQGAVKMAQMVLGKTQRAELKAFAQKVIDDQTKEIDQLKQWRGQWYAGKPPAINMTMPGMMNQGMKIMNGEHMKKMDEMEPEHFDGHFISMMVPHHQGAIDMAKEALKKAEHPEIKDLANRIIAAQSSEIKQMQQWEAAWDKGK
jgi:uncharacterized protein (DUF305 family)